MLSKLGITGKEMTNLNKLIDDVLELEINPPDCYDRDCPKCRVSIDAAPILARAFKTSQSEFIDQVAFTDTLVQKEAKLEADNSLLREACKIVDYTQRSRGYPTPKEWEAVVKQARDALEEK